MQPSIAAIALGSNLADRRAALSRALGEIARACDLIRVSSFIETEPVGVLDQPPFLNACCIVRTTLHPRDLLARLHEIERAMGRDRSRERRWGPRLIDLDLICCAQMRIEEAGLSLPHPRATQRHFVLAPLAQIAPDLRLAPDMPTVHELLACLVAPQPARSPSSVDSSLPASPAP